MDYCSHVKATLVPRTGASVLMMQLQPCSTFILQQPQTAPTRMQPIRMQQRRCQQRYLMDSRKRLTQGRAWRGLRHWTASPKTLSEVAVDVHKVFACSCRLFGCSGSMRPNSTTRWGPPPPRVKLSEPHAQKYRCYRCLRRGLLRPKHWQRDGALMTVRRKQHWPASGECHPVIHATSKGCAVSGRTDVWRHRVDPLLLSPKQPFQHDSVAEQTAQHTHLYVCKPSAGSAGQAAALPALQLLHRFLVCILAGANQHINELEVASAASARYTLNTSQPIAKCLPLNQQQNQASQTWTRDGLPRQ
jgi:hypothetical protein